MASAAVAGPEPFPERLLGSSTEPFAGAGIRCPRGSGAGPASPSLRPPGASRQRPPPSGLRRCSRLGAEKEVLAPSLLGQALATGTAVLQLAVSWSELALALSDTGETSGSISQKPTLEVLLATKNQYTLAQSQP